MTEPIKNPILMVEGEYRLIAFDLTRDFDITRKSKATFQSHSGMQNLFFTESLFWHGQTTGLQATFPAGTVLYIVAQLKSGSYYAQITCDKPIVELFFKTYHTLEDVCSAMKLFLSLNRRAKNNILVQMGLLAYEPDTVETEDIVSLQALRVKVDLCADKMPKDVVYAIRAKTDNNHKCLVSSPEDLTALANIHYGESKAVPVDKKLATDYLRDKTFLSEESIEALATALSQERDREIRILLEGPDACGQNQIIDAISVLKKLRIYTASMAGISSSFEIVGESRAWRDAIAGIPLQIYTLAKTNKCIMVYEDLGELGSSKEHGAASVAVKKILDKEYFDANYQVNMPIGASVIIATTSRVEDLKPAVRGLFDVKLTLSMSDEDKVAAFKKAFLKDIIIGTKTRFTDEALRKIADYTDDYGMNRMVDYAKYLVLKAHGAKFIDEDFVVSTLSVLASASTPYMEYKLHKEIYPESIAQEIEETNKRVLAKGAEERDDYSYLCERLETLSTLRRIKVPFKFDREAFLKEVNESHFGLEKEKLEIADHLTARAIMQPDNNLQLYFVGPPGCGKSSLASAAVRAQGVDEICRIDLTAVTVDEILGLSNSYKGGGHLSLITACLARAGSNNIAVILEEFEKAHQDVINVLLKVLDDDHCYRDRYLDVNIDLSGVTVIATANGTDVQLCTLDRFRVFHFDALSKRVKEGVFDKTVHRIAAESKARELRITVTPDAKELILDEYAQASSVRELDHKLHRITEHLLTGAEESIDGGIDITIDVKAVKDTFPEEPFTRGNFSTIPEGSGVVRALAVTGISSGMTFGLEATVYESSKPGLKITGLADETASEQVELACSYIDMHYNGILEDKRVCVHFSEGTVQKSGCSAGAATLLAILSAALNIPVDRNIAITGEISLHGGVNIVGGIMQKADGAIRDGCHTMVMPTENLERLPIVDREYLERSIRLMGVSSVDELVKLAMPTISAQR